MVVLLPPSSEAISMAPCAPAGGVGETVANTGCSLRFGDRRFRSRRGERSGGGRAATSVEPRERATETWYAEHPPAGILRAVFVGRAAELAELAGRIATAADGRGGLLLLSGPAGIGKTRTVEEAVTGAGAATTAVAWGRCVDDPGAPPLWPWRRVMRTLPGVRAAVADALAGVEGAADLEAARFAMVATTTEALLDAAEPDGLVVVLEDLHWADETSLRLLRHLAGELARSRLLVLGTYRDPAGPAGERLDRALPELLRGPV